MVFYFWKFTAIPNLSLFLISLPSFVFINQTVSIYSNDHLKEFAVQTLNLLEKKILRHNPSLTIVEFVNHTEMCRNKLKYRRNRYSGLGRKTIGYIKAIDKNIPETRILSHVSVY